MSERQSSLTMGLATGPQPPIARGALTPSHVTGETWKPYEAARRTAVCGGAALPMSAVGAKCTAGHAGPDGAAGTGVALAANR
jgi:hypothetical protein